MHAAGFSFIVQLPSGVIRWFSPRSLFDRCLMCRIISVSL